MHDYNRREDSALQARHCSFPFNFPSLPCNARSAATWPSNQCSGG